MDACKPTEGTTFVELAADVAVGARELAVAHGDQLREEVRTEAVRAESALLMLAGGGGLVGTGIVFLLIAGVELLKTRYGWSPAIAWGMVGAIVALTGTLLTGMARQQLHAVRVIPQRTLRSLRESLEWITQRSV
jgi:hypothetical protein